MNSTDPSPVMDFAQDFAGRGDGLIHGFECTEITTGKPMSFAAPTAEELAFALTLPGCFALHSRSF